MTKPTEVIWLWIALVAVAIMPGCQKAAPRPALPPTVVITGCEHFSLITVSRQDTTETKEQVLAHNAEYQKSCLEPGR